MLENGKYYLVKTVEEIEKDPNISYYSIWKDDVCYSKHDKDGNLLDSGFSSVRQFKNYRKVYCKWVNHDEYDKEYFYYDRFYWREWMLKPITSAMESE